MLDVAETMPYSAILRHESRGAHYRTDYTKRDDTNFLKHSVAYKTAGPPRIDYSPVTITRWKPEERVY
jgi:succinate dehydrogenase / fumarate reductase, flavoprotein subunit